MNVLAVLLYAAICALALSAPNGLGSAAASGVAYLVSIYACYGIARMAYRGHNYILWSGAVLGFVAGYLISGLGHMWQFVSIFTMILSSGVVIGRLSAAGRNQGVVYIAGLVVVTLFATAHFAPLSRAMIAFSADLSENAIRWLQDLLVAVGYGADAVRNEMESFRRVLLAMARLTPVMFVLSSVAAFSVSYLLFNSQLNKGSYPGRTVPPFSLWKMPFKVLPMVIITILVRLIGGETLALIADNVLAFLLFFYMITGLSLIDHYLKRFLPNFLRILFYVSLFVFQLAGVKPSLIILFAIVLLGFVDSFADWRKVQQLSLEEK